MAGEFEVKSLGKCTIDSPLPYYKDQGAVVPFTDDKIRIPFDPRLGMANENKSFESAGPRKKIYFDPSKTRVSIVTCGGLCPGLNNVIHTIVMQLSYNYHVKYIFGFQYGYQGFIPKYGHSLKRLTPESIQGIHNKGGSILSSSRGQQDISEIVECLERENIHILFCIGGDGTLQGAHTICKEIEKRKLKISIIGIPKTIDNDIRFCDKSFGFETAFSAAVQSIRSAHIEAYGVPYGVVIVKLMGRDSGFIAANSVLACPDVNFVLIPEVEFKLEGKKGLFSVLEAYLRKQEEQGKHPHAVIVVAEGAGQYFFQESKGIDSSGNQKYGDIGRFLYKSIKEHFKDVLPLNVKYIEPSYLIRSVPATPHDAIYCHHLADHAVHAGMAGKTDMMIGNWNGQFTHVPLTQVVKGKKKIDPSGELWSQILRTTGQPSMLE